VAVDGHNGVAGAGGKLSSSVGSGLQDIEGGGSPAVAARASLSREADRCRTRNITSAIAATTPAPTNRETATDIGPDARTGVTDAARGHMT